MASKERLTTDAEPSTAEYGRSGDTTSHTVSNADNFTNEDYTVGWLCALPNELAASLAMLDQKHPDLLQAEKDSNAYSLGRIGPHNVVLACLPSGTTGTNPAATAAANLLRTFPKIRFGLMVGIGGGAPREPNDDPYEDLRLGDVVVSNPEGSQGKRR
jgi:nucleoside phosphorylase